jgi:hypothetical protein
MEVHQTVRLRARRAFVLVTVMVVSVVIGALVFAYFQAFKHRDAQVRLASDRAAARFLARGALDVLKAGMREAADPKGLANPNLETGPLLEFLLADAASIEKRYKQKTDGKDDHRELLEQLLGKPALEPLDKLVEKLPGAKVKLFLTLEPKPYQDWDKVPVLADPVLKTVAISYRAEAYVRKARETFKTREQLTVYSRLPNGISRFTFVGSTEVGFLNSHRVLASGEDAGGTLPIVLIHSPEDCDPMTENPFELRPGAQKALQTKITGPGDLMKMADDRGMLYMRAPRERPALLQVASGGTPFGEYHTVYQPQGGKTARPAAQTLPDQPQKMKTFRVPYVAPLLPDETFQLQSFVTAAVFGFFAEIDGEESMMGPPPQGALPDGCSQIKPFGTGTHPSAGLVIGHVNRAMAGLSNIAVDRDDTGKDEADQAAAAGRPLPVRETVDPFLRHASAGAYASDLASEGGGSAPSRLLPFQHAVNKNLAPDLDGDGRPDAAVASEVQHPFLPLGSGAWRYGNLFENHDEYARVMSKFVVFPANLSLYLGAQPLERAREVLLNAGFAKSGGPPMDDWVLERFELPHRDTLHTMMDKQKGVPAYLDTRTATIEQLDEVLTKGGRALYPSERTMVVRGQRRFEELFMPGGQMDLQGLKVYVDKEKPDDTEHGLVFDGEVRVKPGSGGWLSTTRVRAKSLVNGGEGADYAPLVIDAELEMTGKGPFECIFVGHKISQDKVKDYTVLRGSVALPPMNTDLQKPLVIAYDPRNDPTGKSAQLYYRLGFSTGPRTYELEDRP